MIAALVALQFVTKPLGQIVTGSCVNLVLTVACLCGGLWCGAATAILSPFFAFLLGIGPALIQLIPAIALGNLSLVAVYAVFKNSAGKTIAGSALSVLLSSAVKFSVLYLLIVKLIMPLLALPDKQTVAMTLMFSWPQLITALIGGSLGVVVSHAVKKSLIKRQDR